MPNITAKESNVRKDVLTKGWKYLFNNFEKFSEPIKIKIALALCTKDIPQELKGEGFEQKSIINIIRPNKETNENKEKVSDLQQRV